MKILLLILRNLSLSSIDCDINFYEYPYLKNILKFFNYKKLKKKLFFHITKLSDNIEDQIIFRKFVKKIYSEDI